MKALIIGERNGLQNLIGNEMKDHGYEVFLSASRSRWPEEDLDVCIDISAKSISNVKAAVDRLKARSAHYLLLSSCLVYPPVPRLYPWHPDHIDLCDETGFSTVDQRVRGLRAAERELHHVGTGTMPWTILRPSIIETTEETEENTLWWSVSRILDGGPIVLPDSDDLLFRHVADMDLARAIRVVAGKKVAFFQTLHVTSQALLSFESYARLIMEGLGRKVPITRVACSSWRDAGLQLPMEDLLRCSFIEDSPLLNELGWQPTDEKEWARIQAGHLVEHPLARSVQRKEELSLVGAVPEEWPGPIARRGQEKWRFTAKAGEPLSLLLESCSGEESLPPPLLRPLKVAMGMAEERFLVNPSSRHRRRILGHNVLLELVDPGNSNLQRGALYLPVAGMDEDGFGIWQASLPASKMVPVPLDLANVALLADPLACLLSVVMPLLKKKSGPVWVFGERIEALLALLLVRESDRSLLHVSRTRIASDRLPFAVQGMVLQRADKKVRDGTLENPDIVINLSGAMDGENLLARSLEKGGCLVTPFAESRKRKKRIDINLPLAATERDWLVQAIELLGKWTAEYNLASYLQPVPLMQPYELFAGGLFRQPFADAERGDI